MKSYLEFKGTDTPEVLIGHIREDAWDVAFKGRKPKRSSIEWERQRKKVNKKMKRLEPFVKGAARPIN